MKNRVLALLVAVLLLTSLLCNTHVLAVDTARTMIVGSKKVLSRIEDEDGNSVEFEFDDRGLLVEIETKYRSENSYSSRIVEYGYDDAGRFLYTIENGKKRVYYEYNAEGNLILAKRYAYEYMTLTDKYVYNSQGGLLYTLSYYNDTLDERTDYVLDEKNRIIQSGTTEDGVFSVSEKYYYDDLGRLSRKTDDENGEYKYFYDDLGRCVESQYKYANSNDIIEQKIFTDYGNYKPFVAKMSSAKSSRWDNEFFDNLYFADAAGKQVWDLGSWALGVWDDMEPCVDKDGYVTSATVSSGGYSVTCDFYYTSIQTFDWNIDSDGVLHISGTGEMIERPWLMYSNKIKKIIINEGCIFIAGGAFQYCENLTEVILPESLIGIGQCAFRGCSSLEKIFIPAGVNVIASQVFTGCANLKRIDVSPDNKIYTNDDKGVLFSKDMKMLLTAPQGLSGKYVIPEMVCYIGGEYTCYYFYDGEPEEETIRYWGFYGCKNLTDVVLPVGTEIIDNCSFTSCYGLKTINIPDSIQTINMSAFEFCRNLQRLDLGAGISNIRIRAFANCDNLSEVFYRGSEKQWGEINIEDYNQALANATIHYDASVSMPTTCPVAELEPVDYLALSSIAYEDFTDEKTIQEYLKDCWNDPWEETDIKYSELFSHVADWKIAYVKENNLNGFFAVAFQNEQKEVVIAYRGSIPLDEGKNWLTWDFVSDWILNDLLMIVFNKVIPGNQIKDALSLYDDVVKKLDPKEIVVTGHSLGGGLGDMVSAATNCRAETFNAISLLDLVYFKYPEILGLNFEGVEQWNMRDHANQYDRLAGVAEERFAVLKRTKPYDAHKSNYADSLGNALKHHGLSSFVEKDESAEVSLTGKQHEFTPTTAISKWIPYILPSKSIVWNQAAIDLGISGNDIFEWGLYLPVSRSSYGGDGDDTIKSSMWDDSLIGGRGDDTMDGGWDNDYYYYFKGDGVDTIYDVSGLDRLYLYGFSETDNIVAAVSSQNASFIDVSCNGEVIVRIYRDNRTYSLVSVDSFNVYVYQDDQEIAKHSITSLFKRKNYGKRIVIACPVNVEILDSQWNVVYTLEDGVPGSYYTEYGNFYVFEEENGEYGKVLDLVEGYSARVVGVAEGTMEASCWEVVDGVLSEEKKVSDIPVTENYVARIDTGETGEIQLTAEAEESHTHTHTWNSGVVTVAPTCEKTGTVLYICTEDPSHTMYVSAPVVDHSYENGKCQFCGLEEPAGIPGDVTGDGKADYSDALLILRASIGLDTLTEDQKQIADVNADGKADYSDALLILRRSIGLE